MNTEKAPQTEPAEPRSVQRMVRCPACESGKMKVHLFETRDGWPVVVERPNVCPLCMGHGAIDNLKAIQFERGEIDLPPYVIPKAPNAEVSERGPLTNDKH